MNFGSYLNNFIVDTFFLPNHIQENSESDKNSFLIFESKFQHPISRTVQVPSNVLKIQKVPMLLKVHIQLLYAKASQERMVVTLSQTKPKLSLRYFRSFRSLKSLRFLRYLRSLRSLRSQQSQQSRDLALWIIDYGLGHSYY